MPRGRRMRGARFTPFGPFTPFARSDGANESNGLIWDGRHPC